MGQAMGPLREMHMLTQAMDLLRQGQLGLCGDVLAGRFMSLHPECPRRQLELGEVPGADAPGRYLRPPGQV